MILKYVIEQDEILVKDYLKEQNLSRNILKKIKIDDAIRINGEVAKNYYPLHLGDTLEIILEEEMNEDFQEGVNDLKVLFEDEYFLIVSKPYNVAIQPSRKHFNDSLFASIKKYYKDKGISANIHIVTRLDMATSGIVLIAKSGYIHSLVNDIEFIKEYICKCENKFEDVEGTFKDKIGRVEEGSIKRWVMDSGKEAITKYTVLDNSETPTVKCLLLTGRTHQIRVHMAYHGHPLIGDKLYGHDADRMYLHCYHLSFIHPVTKKCVDIIDEIPW